MTPRLRAGVAPLLGAVCVAACTAAQTAVPAPSTAREASALALPPAAASLEPAAGARRPIRPGAYDLARLPVFSKVLFYTRENYIDKRRFQARDALLSSLDFVQRDVPEVLVEHRYAASEPWVTVRVNDQSRRYDVSRVDAPWALRSTLQRIVGFVQDNLLPVAPEQERERLLDIETAAVNGMLYTLDPHSVLLDARTYGAIRRVPGTARWTGSVGVEISRDGDEDDVEILEVVPWSPGAHAGLRAHDRIVTVGGLAVASMNLEDVMDHLHGDAGSVVELGIRRTGSPRVQTISVWRGGVPTIAPSSEILKVRGKDGAETALGYLRLRQLSSRAEQGVTAALDDFATAKASGVILDLRGNSGGLYEQAHRVSDAFLTGGMTVSMVGDGNRHKDEYAAASGHEPKLPVVVLVDGQTASGAEIIAAALKDHDRAVIVGERTFGMATIQVLFDIAAPDADGQHAEQPDKLGLKLTTAQWVTPRRQSIQRGGLAPDIELIPQRVADAAGKPAMSFERATRRSAADYEFALAPPAPPADPRPVYFIRYLEVPQARADGRAADNEAEQHPPPVDATGRDYALDVARELLLGAKSASRSAILTAARASIDARRAAEDERVAAAMAKLGYSWAAAPPTAPRGQVRLELEAAPKQGGTAGGSLIMRGTATNVGVTPLHRLRALLKSDSPLASGKELVFGALEPGARRSAEVVIQVPAGVPTMSEPIAAYAIADEIVAADVPPVMAAINGLPPPLLAFSYETTQVGGSADKRKLVVRVRNIGPVAARVLKATLHNLPGPTLASIDVGRIVGGRLEPGASTTCTFVYTADGQHSDQPHTFELSVGDGVLGTATTHRISVEQGGRGAVAGHVTPPALQATAPTVAAGPLVHLTGEASQEGGLRDLFVTVRDVAGKLQPRKAFYLASPDGQRRLPFSADIPVPKGTSSLRVTARSAEGTATVRMLSVTRLQ